MAHNDVSMEIALEQHILLLGATERYTVVLTRFAAADKKVREQTTDPEDLALYLQRLDEQREKFRRRSATQ